MLPYSRTLCKAKRILYSTMWSSRLVAAMVTARELTAKLGGRWLGRDGSAPCPVCQPERRRDQHALSISERGGKILLNCHKSSCRYHDILNAIGEGAPIYSSISVQDKLGDMRSRNERALWAIATSAELMRASRLDTHPYLTAKGLPGQRVPTVSVRKLRSVLRAPKIFDLLPNSGSIALFPLHYHTYQLASVQMIAEDGTKCFMPGGRISGAFHRIGVGTVEILCEGVATGYSLAEAAGDKDVSVLCCMSAGGIKAAAKSVGRAVAADNDKSGVGVAAALSAGLPYAKPPSVGDDFNDLWQSDPRAVKRAVSALMACGLSREAHRTA